jgi:hypothetical protein
VKTELGFHDLRHLADFEREGGVGERGYHRLAVEFAQIPAAIGRAGFVRVLLDQGHEIFASRGALLRFFGARARFGFAAADAWRSASLYDTSKCRAEISVGSEASSTGLSALGAFGSALACCVAIGLGGGAMRGGSPGLSKVVSTQPEQSQSALSRAVRVTWCA